MELYFLVLSMLYADDTQEHYRIRAFRTEATCELFAPAYQELLTALDAPLNIEYAALRCEVRKY